MALHRINPLRGVSRDVDPRGVGREPGAVLMHQRDLAEQIEQLGLRLVHPGRRGQHDIGAAMGLDVGARRLQRHQILPVGHLPAGCRRDEKRATEPIGAGVTRMQHAQLDCLAQIDRRQGQPHPLPERRQPRPDRDQQQQGRADRRQ